jgi:hypothetical protein
LSKHSYYYKAKTGRKGRLASTQTIKQDDDGCTCLVSNETVVDQIVNIKLDPETDYGYKAMAAALMLLGYLINHKKVYRLMKEWQLLHERQKNFPQRREDAKPRVGSLVSQQEKNRTLALIESGFQLLQQSHGQSVRSRSPNADNQYLQATS